MSFSDKISFSCSLDLGGGSILGTRRKGIELAQATGTIWCTKANCFVCCLIKCSCPCHGLRSCSTYKRGHLIGNRRELCLSVHVSVHCLRKALSPFLNRSPLQGQGDFDSEGICPDTKMFLYFLGRHQGKLESLLDSLTVDTQSRKWCGSYVCWVSALFKALIMPRCTLDSPGVLDTIFLEADLRTVRDLRKTERKCSAMQKSINKGER